MTVFDRLRETIAAACPVHGVSLGRAGDPSTVRIDFDPAATAEQRAAASAAVKSFDWSAEAQAAWESARLAGAAKARVDVPDDATAVSATALGLAVLQALNAISARVNAIDLRTGGKGDLPLVTADGARALVKGVIDQLLQ